MKNIIYIDIFYNVEKFLCSIRDGRPLYKWALSAEWLGCWVSAISRAWESITMPISLANERTAASSILAD